MIHAVHTNDMRQMGGLRHKMPITAYTMLIGCLAIAGVGIPFVARLQRLPLEGRDRRAGAQLLRTTTGDGCSWLFCRRCRCSARR